MKHRDVTTIATAACWALFAVAFAYIWATDRLYPFGWVPFIILFVCPLWQLCRGPRPEIRQNESRHPDDH